MLRDQISPNMSWPPPGYKARLQTLNTFNQLFEGDRETIRNWVKLVRGTKQGPLKEFVSFPAPEIAARTLSTFLFGEDARIVSPEAADEIAQLVDDNHLHALNQEAAVTCCVEGEIFYKIDWDEEISNMALISAVSTSMAIPVFRFGRLREVAFVEQVDREDVEPAARRDKGTIFRHIEIRERGTIVHRLYRGTPEKLGNLIPLEAGIALAGLEEEVQTDIDDLLVRHVPFWRTSKSPHGISIFRGKEGLIDALHSLYTQDQHDAEMAKKRVAISSEYLARDSSGKPKFDRDLDLFELSDTAAGSVGTDSKPIHPIEFTDSNVMGERIAQRLDEFLLACGIAPQSAGRNVAGTAESGTARKLAQALTLQTVATAGRYFAPALRDIVTLALEVSAKHLRLSLPNDFGVSVEMQDGLVTDEREQSLILQSLEFAHAMSYESKVRLLHPDWDEEAVAAEVQKIKEDQGLTIPDVMADFNQTGNMPTEDDNAA